MALTPFNHRPSVKGCVKKRPSSQQKGPETGSFGTKVLNFCGATQIGDEKSPARRYANTYLSLVTGEKPVGAYFAERNSTGPFPPDGENSTRFRSSLPAKSCDFAEAPQGNGSARPRQSIQQSCSCRPHTAGGSLGETRSGYFSASSVFAFEDEDSINPGKPVVNPLEAGF